MIHTPKVGDSRGRYADVLRDKITTGDNPTGAPMSIRALARACGLSYEHCRKLICGEPVASKAANAAICAVLGLPADRMYRLCCAEKLQRKAKGYQLPALPPADSRMARIWPLLNDDERQTLISIAEAFAKGRELSAGSGEPDGAQLVLIH